MEKVCVCVTWGPLTGRGCHAHRRPSRPANQLQAGPGQRKQAKRDNNRQPSLKGACHSPLRGFPFQLLKRRMRNTTAASQTVWKHNPGVLPPQRLQIYSHLAGEASAD